jgi:hypothetical protein
MDAAASLAVEQCENVVEGAIAGLGGVASFQHGGGVCGSCGMNSAGCRCNSSKNAVRDARNFRYGSSNDDDNGDSSNSRVLGDGLPPDDESSTNDGGEGQHEHLEKRVHEDLDATGDTDGTIDPMTVNQNAGSRNAEAFVNGRAGYASGSAGGAPALSKDVKKLVHLYDSFDSEDNDS